MLQRDVAPGIHRVEDAYVNWYIVEEGTQVLIVDCGVPRSWRSLTSALADLGRAPQDVEAVLLTHAHPDHIGFAERARTEWHVPLWLHERDVSLSRHPFNYEHERSSLRYPSLRGLRIAAAMGRGGALFTKPLGEVRGFADETEFDLPGRPRPIHTPGHTHGHTAFHFPDRGAVLVGDAIATHEPYTGKRGPRVPAGASNVDSAQAIASLTRIAETQADVVLVGHGDPWTGGAVAAVDHAREAGPS